MWLPSQERGDYLVVNGPENLLDIEILERESTHATPVAAPIPPTIPLPSEDPAILSYRRPPQTQATTQTSTNITITHEPQTGNGLPVSPAAQQIPHTAVGRPQQASQSSTEHAIVLDHGTTSATLTGPFEELHLNGEQDGDNGELLEQGGGKDLEAPAEAVSNKYRRRRSKRALKKENMPQDSTEHLKAREQTRQQIQKASPESKGKAGRQQKNTGWREPPFLEEALGPNKKLLRPRNGVVQRFQLKRQKERVQNDQNGWATEDATDIQDMGDFDFSANLSKFDKPGTFSQFKQDDTTADEDRLVTHNRLPPRPGTAGGRNLHYTENVLDSPKINQSAWASGDSENDLTDANFGSGKSSHRNLSRTSTRQLPSRKSSVRTNEQHLTGSGSLPESKSRARGTPRETSTASKLKSDISSSRDTITRITAHSEKTSSRKANSAQRGSSFRFVSKLDTTSNIVCPCLSAVQMLELEQLAMTEFGLTKDILTENAARAIAELSLRQANTHCRALAAGGDINVPHILVLAGNNKTGARAIAGARQVLNHDTQIFLTVLGLEQDDELHESVRRQLSIFRSCGGQVTRPDRILKALRKPPNLIVDAFLGIHMNFDDLPLADQEPYTELVSYVNSHGPVMAIDVPSGMECMGRPSHISSGPNNVSRRGIRTIYPDYVLSLGAPMTALEIYMARQDKDKDCEFFVADIGITNKVWKKFGTRFKEGVHFGRDWVAALEYFPGSEKDP